MRNELPEVKDNITGIILAGGLARRMDRKDKGLLDINGKPLIGYVIDGLAPQVRSLVINANRNQEQYAKFGYPVISDNYPDYRGPLAGMYSCIVEVNTEYMLTVPCDSPFIPVDLASRLFNRMKQERAEISVASNGRRMQPVFALISIRIMDSLLDFLERGERRIDKWYAEQHTVTADFSDKMETFVNINTPEKLLMVEAVLEND